ncbi:MAG: hypothetical protein KAS32_13670 [Candidatus Peribacteraceae bacterium]|nr:hypothetical protein [Candidatus Peribacteraceae bacterium]
MTFTITQTPNAQNIYIYPWIDDSIQFTPSTGSDSFELLNEAWNDPDTTDFVFMTAINDLKDRYHLTNPSESGTINYVRLIAYAKADFVSTAPTLHLHTELSSVEDEGSSNDLTGSYTKYYETFILDPSGGAWSWTDINGVAAGFKGTIADREFYYKRNNGNTSNGVWADSDGYIFIASGNQGLRAYSYTDADGFTLITGNDQGGVYDKVFVDSNDVIFVGSGSGNELHAYTFNGTAISLEDSDSKDKAGQPYKVVGIHGDGNFIYVAWYCSYYEESILQVYEYTGGALVEKDSYDFTGVYGDVILEDIYYDGTYIYVIGEDKSANGVIWALSYNSGTDTLAIEDTVSDSSDGRCIWGDGTYIYAFWEDGDMKAYTCDGSFSAVLGTVSTANGNGNRIFCDDDGYIFVAIGHDATTDSLEIYTFNGSSFTEIETFTGIGDMFYAPYVYQGHLFVGCDNANCRVYNFSTIKVAQMFVVVNFTPSSTVVTLVDPKNVDLSHSRKIERKNLPNGNYIVYDAGRGAKTLTITGTETSGAYSDMDELKTVCHYGAKVTVAGLDDTNLNTDYWVSDLQFSAGAGYPANMYDYALTLEEL